MAQVKMQLMICGCRVSWLVVALILVVEWCGIGEGVDSKFPALIVFGDSTVDVGTNNYIPTVARGNFPPYGENFEGGKPTGRFSNGLMVNDFVAKRLGLPLNLPYLDPSAEGERILYGVNFASAASGFLDDTSKILSVVPAFEQLKMFSEYQAKLVNLVGQDKASFIVSKALYMISAGSNDFLVGYFGDPKQQQQYTPTEWSDQVASKQKEFVKQLYAAGARNMFISGFPPMGCLPVIRTIYGGGDQVGHTSTPRCVENFNDVSLAYNKQLRTTLTQLQSTLPGSHLVYGDIYSHVYEAFHNPSKYGYSEVQRGCCGKGMIAAGVLCHAASEGTCADPSTYLFFDSVHPTEKCYKAVAEQVYVALSSFV